MSSFVTTTPQASNFPAAYAVLDPKRPDCNYPFDGLCGCGVVFKLIQAHASTLGVEVQELEHYLDLVATASAADIVPILDENRVLTYFGMKVYQQSPRPGLMALLGERKQRAISSYRFGFSGGASYQCCGTYEAWYLCRGAIVERQHRRSDQTCRSD